MRHLADAQLPPEDGINLVGPAAPSHCPSAATITEATSLSDGVVDTDGAAARLTWRLLSHLRR
jgi:hypothetical protein